jgi:hypothetical protein
MAQSMSLVDFLPETVVLFMAAAMLSQNWIN